MDPVQKLCMDTERVITAVELQPAIWNPFEEHYKNKRKRAAAWRAVCGLVFDHYNRFHEEDQRELEKRVQQRWRTARDCYVKARMRTPASGAADTPYAFMEHLAFLEPTLRHPRPHPAGGARAHTKTLPTSVAPGAGGADKPRGKRAFRRPVQAQAAAPAERDADSAAGDMTDFERQLLAVLKKTESPLEADDENFFRSLAPMLSAFDSHHKLLFRSRVLATALDLQMQTGSVYVEAPPINHEEEFPVEEFPEEPPEKKYRPPDAGDYSTDDSQHAS